MSAPKPASVMQKPSSPTSFRASWSAMMDELPCAMLAKGPACTKTGVCSTVCMHVGMMASFMSTHSAQPTPRSSAVMGSPALLMATTMLPRRSRMSRNDVVSASTAITSEATVILKPVQRSKFSALPTPVTTSRRKRSQTSTTRCHVIVAASTSRRANLLLSSSLSSSTLVLLIPSLVRRFSMIGENLRVPSFSRGHKRLNKDLSLCWDSWYMRVSSAAANKLLAAPTA
jgi:hypothetical protein